MGKIKVDNHNQFHDVSTIVALNDNYCTGEPFIDPEYGFRIQKVGPSYCVMKKLFTGSGWKSHFGGAALMGDELTPQYKLWVDECSKLFGGMDILAIDGIHGKNGKDYIIELNCTAIGIMAERWLKDSLVLVDLVIDRLNGIYCKGEGAVVTTTSETTKPPKLLKKNKLKPKPKRKLNRPLMILKKNNHLFFLNQFICYSLCFVNFTLFSGKTRDKK
ncbi:synapsin IIa [Reticulomyxa filosa]|uniref:Synapsin IIa n=1 Tax=Reticulomyxa filosa TaxID=46433 RepID=X6MWY2_RETFI|nr:synapsin IIa [Reticulomyxa filosa]|eukprot:ETO17977.1 synapsin IIa [Reticulomyxa filosa]